MRNETDKLLRIFQLLSTVNVPNLNILCKYDQYIINQLYTLINIVFQNKIISLKYKDFVSY